MAFTIKLTTGSTASIDRDQQTRTRTGVVLGTLPYAGQDCFDYISNLVMTWMVQQYPTYSTPFGTLYLNSIQLSEEYYAQKYTFSATYGVLNKMSGTYQITVDQAVGSVHITAGRRIAGYNGTGTCPDNDGTFFDGQQVTGTDIPVAEDRFSISYRHPQAWLNAAYIRNVGRLRGYPNNDTFLGYDPGEVMYMGGNFTQTDSEASASYSFAVSPNATNIVVGACTITEKKGWDVASPTWEPDVDGNDNAVKKVLGIEIIRPREWKAYRSVFGWG